MELSEIFIKLELVALHHELWFQQNEQPKSVIRVN